MQFNSPMGRRGVQFIQPIRGGFWSIANLNQVILDCTMGAGCGDAGGPEPDLGGSSLGTLTFSNAMGTNATTTDFMAQVTSGSAAGMLTQVTATSVAVIGGMIVSRQIVGTGAVAFTSGKTLTIPSDMGLSYSDAFQFIATGGTVTMTKLQGTAVQVAIKGASMKGDPKPIIGKPGAGTFTLDGTFTVTNFMMQ